LTTISEDMACTRCGCVCDDLTITVEDGRITAAEGACGLAEPWFLDQGKDQPAAATIDGRPTGFENAIERAAEILAAARNPLIYGLSRSSTEGQRAAVRLSAIGFGWCWHRKRGMLKPIPVPSV